INWGVKDYWAIPKEFFPKFGDCEDYAITKYFTLRALGWKAEDMEIVILQDLNLRIAHAILVVKFEGKKMVLDNQIGLVVDSKRIRHYRPIYSVNENGWWRYKPS
ncbi:MAG: transglutaminase-like cysteine peptidase, partial [Sneathiella sp.]|nr:transglutaminase-like cysteine peptidase [Sneathiella sp.]